MNILFKTRQQRLTAFARRRKSVKDNNSPKRDEKINTCPKCGQDSTYTQLKENLYVCPHCGRHYKISAKERIRQLTDENSFREIDRNMTTVNSENFEGYTEKLEKYKADTGLKEAVVTGTARIGGIRCAIGVMDSHFMMGSMGGVVGEKITRLIELATKKNLPLIISCASGGARMQEGIISLFQMSKTTAALKKFSDNGGLYISLLTHPTTGGVSASFATLGDIIIAEPDATIGFAGKRVIEKTINQQLPDHFQTSQFLLEKGFVDMICPRQEIRQTVSDLLALHCRTDGKELNKTVHSSDFYQSSRVKNSRGITAWQRVQTARHTHRPKAQDYLELLFDSFYPLHGDRHFGDDGALLGGLAFFHGLPVTVLAQTKGKDLQENMDKNFGMMHPEGYRKALRLAKQAEKFHRPVITFVDTSGAYPGKGAEERGQAEAIAQCLMQFSDLKTPVICVVLSEGGSGGALALSVADRIAMLENAVYSILSPEGFASILWKDGSRVQEAAEAMKPTAYHLQEKGIIDHIIREPAGGAQENIQLVADGIDSYLSSELATLLKKKEKTLLEERYEKFRRIGTTE